MRFATNRGMLETALSAPCAIADGRSGVAELACVKVESDGSSVAFEASNGNDSVRTELPMPLVEEGGAALVPAQKLMRAVKSFPDEAVEFACDASGAHVACGKVSLDLKVLPVEGFPSFGDVDAESSVKVDGADFARCVQLVQASADHSARPKKMPVLCGLGLKTEGGELAVSASDSYSAAQAFAPCEGGELDVAVPLAWALTLASQAYGDLEISTNGRIAKAVTCDGQVVMRTRLLEGRFPRISPMFGKARAGAAVSVSVADMARTVRRAAGIGAENTRALFESDGSTLFVAAKSDDGAISDSIDAQGDPFRFYAGTGHMLDCMAKLDGQVLISSASDKSPVVFEQAGDHGYRALCMPMVVPE